MRPFFPIPIPILGPRLAVLAALAVLTLWPAVPASAQTVPETRAEIALSLAPVVKAAAPAVVNIYATRVVENRVSPFAGDPFFEHFFGDFAKSGPRVQNSLGSGVVVSPDGIVVSNYHVVGMATEIRVVMNDRREYAATVILSDRESDLAILKLEGARDLPALDLSDSDLLEVGDLVLAIGNPFGVGQTVSSGIISGLARPATFVGDGRGIFIQTDAAINPGNSGGALVDGRGRLVGINTAILSRSGGSLGIGFAIPSNLVAAVLRQALEGSDRFRRPWAGVSGQPVDAALAEALGLDRPDGVVLTELHELSPFAGAGLSSGDVIVSVNGLPANSPQEIMARLATGQIGTEVLVGYLREGALREAQVALIAAPDVPDREARTIPGDTRFGGLSLARINPAVIEELGLPTGAQGVVVTAAEGPAAQAGLRRGDILVAINGQRVADTETATMLGMDGVRRWLIDLLRAGEPLRLRIRG